jgi:hypothetical protein
MIPAGAGSGFTVNTRIEGMPSPQRKLCPFTVIFPETAVESNETMMLLVPFPAVMTAPEGNDQI